jgi:hypothetical protein
MRPAENILSEETGEMKREIKAAHADTGGRAYVGASGLLLAIIAIAGITFCSACSGSNGTTDKPEKKGKAKKQVSGTPFSGGTFEASGAAYVPGADGILFVDDSRPGEVFWMQIDQAGQQVGDIKHIPLGVTVENPEGITSDGSYFYIVGSQAIPKGGERNAIARFAFDPNTQSVKDASVIGNLREWLLSRVADLKGAGEMKGSKGGLNIEGLAWDPERKQLLLGLRSPIINEQALIVPVKLGNPAGPFSSDNLQLGQDKAIPVSLGGSGIRDIQYDNKLKSFLLISGAPENEEKGDFILWQWDGTSGQPIQKSVLDKKVKPEGVTSVEVGGQNFIYIVCDASRYTKIDYTDLD